MATTTEIDNAIGAHSMWKMRLKAALETGRMDAPIAALDSDRDCPFGKWLQSPTIAPSTKASVHYAKVRELHTQFHRAVVEVATLAVNGRTDLATEMMTTTGAFSQASAKLTVAMQEWRSAMS